MSSIKQSKYVETCKSIALKCFFLSKFEDSVIQLKSSKFPGNMSIPRIIPLNSLIMMELTFHYKMSDPLQISAQSTFTIYHHDQISQFPLS